MKNKITILILLIAISATTYAQNTKMDDDEKAEKREAKNARIKDKTDYNLFHRQMLSLKEYNDERKKIPSLQKANKMPVKVVAVVDTTEGDDEGTGKTMTGYIRQEMGDNTVNVYEITFDRIQKKIVAVKRTGEGEEVEKDEDATEKKTTPKKTIHKKNKDDDDDDDGDDDAPAKKKQKDDDN